MGEPVKASRPKVLVGLAVKEVTACGSIYVKLFWCGGKLFEVFATLGHSGGCPAAQSEALTRCISRGLRYGVPVGEYVKQLRGIQCPQPMLFPKDQRVLSCPDAIGKVIQEYSTVSEDRFLELLRAVNGTPSDEDTGEPLVLGELIRTREELGLR